MNRPGQQREMGTVRRLLIISHGVHRRHNGQIHAYVGFAREIDVWADIFPEVIIAAPCRDAAPPGDYRPFTRSNIRLTGQPEAGGPTLWAKLQQFILLPLLIGKLCWAMATVDAIHVRCPGNLGLLGAILAPLFSRNIVAKYAGPWSGFPEEPWTWKLQRRILRSFWWRGPVTVYSRSDNHPTHVVPFFTSIMTRSDMERARQCARNKKLGTPLRVLFVGRLVAEKNVDVLLSAIASLHERNIPVHCTIVGEGPQRKTLERLSAELGLAQQVTFAGGVDFEHVLDFYEDTDVLVLASLGDSWGKAVTEAMAFGAVCIASDRDMAAEHLKEGRGVNVPAKDATALAQALRKIAETPAEYEEMSARAAAYAQQFSLEMLRDRIRELLVDSWTARRDAPASTVKGTA